MGCLSTVHYDEITPPPEVNPKKQVRLKAGDNITIGFYFHPEFQTIQTIREDGRIFLKLIDEIYVEGLTPRELQRKLEENYGRYVDRVSVSVVINSVAPKQIYMSGAVALNQVIGFHGEMTVLKALIRSGGASGSGKLDSVLVIRNQGTAEPLVYKVNVKDTIRNRGRDFVLQHHVVVYVPTRVITKINQFVAEYIDGIVPRHIGFGYSPGGLPQEGEAEVDFNINLP